MTMVQRRLSGRLQSCGPSYLNTSVRNASEQQHLEPTRQIYICFDRKGRSLRMEAPSFQPTESAGEYHQEVARYVHWPNGPNRNGSAEQRAAYFNQLHQSTLVVQDPPVGRQATTMQELMMIRAYHSRALRCYSLGTALGLRSRGGQLTNLPAIIVFVSRKVHEQWLLDSQKLPSVLHGPGGLWCDIDVIEFSSYGSNAPVQSDQIFSEMVEGLRGKDADIGPGSQVATEEKYGTLGAVVRSRNADRAVGFLTNHHVAVDFDQPKQKMYHPLPPSLGPGAYLGSVERATSFASDHAWYGVFAGRNPETFARADGAFIPFRQGFNMATVTTRLKGVGEMGSVYDVDINDHVGTLIGRRVAKLGGSSGLTTGSIRAYAVEYNDDKGICFLTDFLILGEGGMPFDVEGDSGSLIVLLPSAGEQLRPIGIIWGGTANRGRLKLCNGDKPENWTSGIDLGRLLNLLELELITNPMDLIVEATSSLSSLRKWPAEFALAVSAAVPKQPSHTVNRAADGGQEGAQGNLEEGVSGAAVEEELSPDEQPASDDLDASGSESGEGSKKRASLLQEPDSKRTRIA